MLSIFSSPWLACLQQSWNRDPELPRMLARVGFSARIGYGFPQRRDPAAVIVVKRGMLREVGDCHGRALDWDLRAEPEDWRRLIEDPPGLLRLSLAYTGRRLAFRRGSYTRMIKDPNLARPFVRSFVVMAAAERCARANAALDVFTTASYR